MFDFAAYGNAVRRGGVRTDLFAGRVQQGEQTKAELHGQ
jgi:hypothetical protein